MVGRSVSCSFLPLKSSVLRKETICALWCGSEKKRPTPHFKMLCRRASRSGSLEERARRQSYSSNERSLSSTWRISNSGGVLSYKKTQKQIMENADTIVLTLMGITFQPKGIFTLRICQKLETVNQALN